MGENGSEDWLHCRVRVRFKLLWGVFAALQNVRTVVYIIHPSREYLRQQLGGWVMTHVLTPGGCHQGNNLQGLQITTHFRPSKCSKVYCVSFMHLSLKQ